MSTLKLKVILAAVVWAVVLLILAPTAQAASLCGVEASGKKADGTTWTGVAPRMFVGDDGFWHICQSWIPDGGNPLLPEPKPEPKDCAEARAPITWQVGELTCTSYLPMAEAKHNQLSIALADVGQTRGILIQRCVNGERTHYGAQCSYSNGCDRAATINTRVGNVSVDSTPRKNGTKLTGLKAERGTVDMQCSAGSWVVTRTVSR